MLMYTENELKQKLTEFRRMPSEMEWLEFKEAKANYSFDELGKYFSALSNEANLKGKHSGWLIFGIRDKAPREIVGTLYRRNHKDLESLKHEIARETGSITFQEIYELHFPEGRVILFQIPAAPAGIPTSWKGHFFGRDGESLVPLSIQELEAIRAQVASADWSAGICPDAGIAELDDEALRVAKTKFQKKHTRTRFAQEIDTWDTPTFLEKAKLTRNGKLTRTAILLLGKSEAAHHLTPHPAQITWKLDEEEQAYEHFGPPFLLTVEDVFSRIRNIRFRIQPFNRLIPIELTKYDSTIILEALNNCIAHQDYTQNARIILIEKGDRLILQNIGGFYDGTVEDYVLRGRTPERYRNPFLAQAMVHLDMIDTMGMGIRRMFLEQRRRFFPLPEYDLHDPNHVYMTVFGKLIDENYSKILIEEENLTLQEVIALDKIQKKETISQEAARLLRRKKLIEGRYPNLFVAAKIAQVTASKADYTKHRAFDKKYYKDLILQFLDQHGEATPADLKRLIEDKLSDLLTESQKKAKVRNLLQEMVKEGVIENVGGRGLGARWILCR